MPGKTLAEILSSARTTADSGQPAVFTLSGGLTVRVALLDQPGQYRITGERDKVQPSNTEMDLLRRNFGGEQIGDGLEWVGYTCRKWLDVERILPAEVTQ